MKKGFTLIELLFVIALLGVIAVVATPAVNNMLQTSRENAYQSQIKTIEETARTYMSKNPNKLPNTNEKLCVTVSELQTSGLLDKNGIKNPKYQKDSEKEDEKFEYFEGTIIITNIEGRYTYKYQKSCS